MQISYKKIAAFPSIWTAIVSLQLQSPMWMANTGIRQN